jgi:hypothetical protein
MLRFWQNPEFVRHRRSELRQARALTVVAVVIVVCVLVGLACWGSRESAMEAARTSSAEYGRPSAAKLAEMERQNPVEFWHLFYRSLMWIQAGILTFWSLLSCAQAVSGERERKTWDFQRTTRMTPLELLVGKLVGEPVLAYFIVLCCFPVSLVAGLRGGVAFLDVLAAYLLIVSSALFVGLGGLWISSLLETRSRGIGLIGTFGLYFFLAMAFSLRESGLPGLGAFSPLSGLFPLLGDSDPDRFVATIFGRPVSWLLMSLLLYLTFGTWFMLMLVRNLKRDYAEIRPLSRWQAVGCAAFLNFTLYALFHPQPSETMNARDFATFVVLINGTILFAMGLATLTPLERLKVWWRKRQLKEAGLFSEDGLPWPWLALSAVVAYGLLVWGSMAYRDVLHFETSALQSGAVQFLAVLIFITRDVLFIQWCKLTRLRSPLVKGFLFVGLYYIAALVVTIVFGIHSQAAARWIASLLTPAGVFDAGSFGFHFPASVFWGMALQLGAIGILLAAITRRLGRPAAAMAMAAD